MMAWIVIVCGCIMAAFGALSLNGWRAEQWRQPRKDGWGTVAMGGSLALIGVSRLPGWPIEVGLALSIVGLAFAVLSFALRFLSGMSEGLRRHDKTGRQVRTPTASLGDHAASVPEHAGEDGESGCTGYLPRTPPSVGNSQFPPTTDQPRS